MFARPGGGSSTLRPDSSPAPWQDSDAGDSGLAEHHRLDSAVDLHTALHFEARQPADESGRPAFLADESPGSGLFLADSDSDSAGDTFPPDQPVPLPEAVSFSRGERRALCRICFAPVARASAETCDECQTRAEAAGDGAKVAARARRIQQQHAPNPARRAFFASVGGVILIVAGIGVVRYVSEAPPGIRITQSAQKSPIVVRFAFDAEVATGYRTEIDVRLHRENRRNPFESGLRAIFDVKQLSEYLTRVTLVRSEGDAAILTVYTESSLKNQDGEYVTRDGLPTKLYQWDGDVQITEVRARAEGQIERTHGGLPVPAHDVPPFMVFGTTGAPSGHLEPEMTWDAVVVLPCVTDLDGAIVAHPFDCRFKYVGGRVLDGHVCAIVELSAKPVRELGEGFESLENVGGSVDGALAFDVGTGLLVTADLEIDTTLSRGADDDPEERVSMTGELTISRGGSR